MRRRTTRACYGSISNGSRDDISVAGKCGRSLCEQNFAARTGDAGDIHGDRPAHLRARLLSPACRLALPPPAGKKSPATANFLFDAQPNLFGIARQIKKSANFVHGLFAYRLAERRGFEPLKPFRGLLAFQAGQFNHSCTFPRIKKKEPTIRPVDSLRRERDSNPRYSCPYTAFRVRPDRPLRHLSKIAAERGKPRLPAPSGATFIILSGLQI